MSEINNSEYNAPFIPDGVIMDLDGLMLDTERLYIQIYVKISREMGWPTPESMLRKVIGINDNDAEILYKKEYGDDYPFREIWPVVIDEFILEGNKNGIPHKPGLLIFLDKLDSLGIPIAVATSTFTERAKWKLERSGIKNRFKALVFGDEVERGKPEPDIFLLACQKLGFKPENCIGFEDSSAGLIGLAKAGISPVFIRDLAEPTLEALGGIWRRCDNLEEAALLFG